MHRASWKHESQAVEWVNSLFVGGVSSKQTARATQADVPDCRTNLGAAMNWIQLVSRALSPYFGIFCQWTYLGKFSDEMRPPSSSEAAADDGNVLPF